MKLTDGIRRSLRNRADRKAEKARHRLDEVTRVVAIVDHKGPVPVTVVLNKYVRIVDDIRSVVRDLTRDHKTLELRAMTCAYNNPFTYVNRLTGESYQIASYCQAEVHLHELTHTIRTMLNAINAFDPHPDYKVMRRSAKALAKSAA